MEAGKHDRQIIERLPGLLTLYSDGSFERLTDLDLPACLHFVDGLASKDVVLDPSSDIWARIFLPQLAAHQKLPLVLHFHGGGFCFGSPASPYFHHFCSRMALASRSIWISVNYRLAPENRLPAAFDDAYAALLWLHSQALLAQGHAGTGTSEPWLSQHADFSKCFLAGESAGATIVHNLAVRAAATEWSPVKILGLLPIHGGFISRKPIAGVKLEDADLGEVRMDFYHKSALPPGASWGHPFMNPLHPDCPKLSEMELPPVFVAVAERDTLCEGGVEYYEALKKAGKEVELFESKAEGHCFHLRPQRSAAAELLEKKMMEFMKKLC